MYTEHLTFHEDRSQDVIFLFEAPPETSLGTDVNNLLTMKMEALAASIRSIQLISATKVIEIIKTFKSVEISSDKN